MATPREAEVTDTETSARPAGPVGFGRKSLERLPDECSVNASGLHRFQRPTDEGDGASGRRVEEEG
jgi:hypothetical protein